MPKALLNLNDFSGGLIDAVNPRDIAPNQMSDTDNIILDERSYIKSEIYIVTAVVLYNLFPRISNLRTFFREKFLVFF